IAHEKPGSVLNENQHVSPLFGDFRGFPPVLIQVGENEAYFSDSARLADRLAQANVDVRLQKWPRVFHVWQAWSPLLPQAREAVASAGEFIKRQLA
ncbi:alpha/beta hydrolase, partial [Komagataeibacter europaeus]|uniref:alpha/beta hydrolase n=1 Tax=Komagataeibacter europaeus TaxID=33995 RepID=UPI001650D786